MAAPIVIKSTDVGAPMLNCSAGGAIALLRYIAAQLQIPIIYDANNVIVLKPASYKNNNPLYYRFDDSVSSGCIDTRLVKVSAYESMSDIDTGIGHVGTVFMSKGKSVDTSACPYKVVGDQYGFYIFTVGILYNSGTSPTNLFYFGATNPLSDGDLNFSLISGQGNASDQYSSLLWTEGMARGYNTSYPYIITDRDRAGNFAKNCSIMGGAQYHRSEMSLNNQVLNYGSVAVPTTRPIYPLNGKILLDIPYLNDGDPFNARCLLPGLYGTAHNISITNGHFPGSNYSWDSLRSIWGILIDQHILSVHSTTSRYDSWWCYGAIIIDTGTLFRP